MGQYWWAAGAFPCYRWVKATYTLPGQYRDPVNLCLDCGRKPKLSQMSCLGSRSYSQCTRHLRPLPHGQMLRNTRRMVSEGLCDWRRVIKVSRREMLTAGQRFHLGKVKIGFEIKYLQKKINK